MQIEKIFWSPWFIRMYFSALRGKWNESGFRPCLCTYRLNWARRTSWGWWDDWDDTVLQTQDSKFEPWRSEAEHATSRSRRLPTILTFTRGWGRNNFVSFKPPRPGTEPRTLAWKAAVLTTTLGPPPLRGKYSPRANRVIFFKYFSEINLHYMKFNSLSYWVTMTNFTVVIIIASPDALLPILIISHIVIRISLVNLGHLWAWPRTNCNIIFFFWFHFRNVSRVTYWKCPKMPLGEICQICQNPTWPPIFQNNTRSFI